MGSVKSVGNYLNRRFCVFREFCGSTPRGCSCLSCTNRAAIASSHRIHRTHRNLLLKCTPTEFTEFSCRGELLCVLCILWDNAQPKHLCASVPSVGGLLSGRRGGGGGGGTPPPATKIYGNTFIYNNPFLARFIICTNAEQHAVFLYVCSRLLPA